MSIEYCSLFGSAPKCLQTENYVRLRIDHTHVKDDMSADLYNFGVIIGIEVHDEMNELLL